MSRGRHKVLLMRCARVWRKVAIEMVRPRDERGFFIRKVTDRLIATPVLGMVT